MKRSFLAIIIVLSFSFNIKAMWAMIPTEQLIKETDLVVIGTLQGVNGFTKDDIDYSEGTILIEKVIAGNDTTTSGEHLESGDRIVIKWQNSSMIACPRVEHKGDENTKGIWLLEVESDGTVSSDYPWRFRPLNELDKLKKILRKTKVRRNLTRIAIVNETPSSRIEARPSTTEHETEEIPTEVNSTATTQEYSPVNAIVVFALFTFLYCILYRSRFRIR
jgi:hypothetical protein